MTKKQLRKLANDVCVSTLDPWDFRTPSRVADEFYEKFLARKKIAGKVVVASQMGELRVVASTLPLRVILLSDSSSKSPVRVCNVGAVVDEQSLIEAAHDAVAEHVQQGRISLNELNRLLELKTVRTVKTRAKTRMVNRKTVSNKD